MVSYAAQERQALADALLEAGPDAPTLCTGWTAADLAAHLVARERRADSGPGLVLPALAGWTERARRGYLRRPFPELVGLVRGGPPRVSLFALPGVDAAANLTEHFVHCEDVRRARPGWTPRVLPDGMEDAFWGQLRARARMMFRRSPVPVTLRRTDASGLPTGDEVRVGAKGPGGVVLTGPASELVLHAFNRTSATTVEVGGDPAAVQQFQQVRLGL